MPGLSYDHGVSFPLRIAQAVGITATAFLAGQTASTTYLFTPALLEAPAPLLARQWKKVWLTARSTAPVFSIGLSVLFGYLAYKEPSSHTPSFRLYALASFLLPSQIPYTLLLMGPLNSKILEKAESLSQTALSDIEAEAGVSQEETVHALVDKWATLNLGRAFMVGVAAFSAVWATLSKVEVVA